VVEAVDHVLVTIGAAIGMFVGTHIDDLVVLTVLFLSCHAVGRPRGWQIVAGQYAGVGVLVAVSEAAALGLRIVPDPWVGLLGVLPIALGLGIWVRAFWTYTAGHALPVLATSITGVSGLAGVAGVTIVDGGDNISVYTPVFRAIGITDSLIMMAVFGVMLAVWCAAAGWLGSHRRGVAVVRQSGPWLVPIVFVAIGTTIMVRSGVVGRLVDALHYLTVAASLGLSS
jgi:cadmium resistance protein CadD (predicted permease)